MNRDEVEERREQILRLHAEGRTPGEIAALTGCSPPTIYRTLESGSAEDGRRQNGWGKGWADQPADDGASDRTGSFADPYAGIGIADYDVVAAADSGSLVPEVTLLRAYVRLSARSVVAAAGNERRQAAQMARTGRLIDALVRVVRAGQRGRGSSEAEERIAAIDRLVADVSDEMFRREKMEGEMARDAGGAEPAR